MAEFDFDFEKPDMKGIPEARLEKQLILSLHFDCITRMSLYASTIDPGRRKLSQWDFQASLIGLYNKLVVKLKPSEKRQLEWLEKARYQKYLLTMEYLVKSFDILSGVIQRLGISQFEREVYDINATMA
jgi:hypothetical protein